MFTSEEAWEFSLATKLILYTLPIGPRKANLTDEERADWENLFALREPALAELEKARQEKLSAKPLKLGP